MTAPVPFVDLSRCHAPLRDRIKAAVTQIIDTERFIGGPAVERFERRFAGWVGAGHGIGVSNGTEAIELALRALGIGPGDEVIVPAMTFVATAEAVVHAGATPVCADVEIDTGAIDVDAAGAAIGQRTAAIVAVHLYGSMADARRLRELCDRRGLALVEDAAQAHGATRDGLRAGSVGDAATFSFYPSKNLGAFGDAGAVVTSRADVAEKVRKLREHGGRDEHAAVGRTARLDAVQAAILDVCLDSVDEWNDDRRRVAETYDKLLADHVQTLRSRGEPVHHVFGTLLPDRDAVAARLAEAGIGTGVHYRRAIHEWPAFAGCAGRGAFPNAERIGREELSLPMFPGLTDDELRRVADELWAALSPRLREAE